MCVAPDDQLLATGSQDKTAKLWDRRDLSLVATLLGHKRGIWCAQFSPADRLLATGSADVVSLSSSTFRAAPEDVQTFVSRQLDA